MGSFLCSENETKESLRIKDSMKNAWFTKNEFSGLLSKLANDYGAYSTPINFKSYKLLSIKLIMN